MLCAKERKEPSDMQILVNPPERLNPRGKVTVSAVVLEKQLNWHFKGENVPKINLLPTVYLKVLYYIHCQV